IEAVVLGIDTDKERISLGIKQLEGDPFNNFVATFDKGAVVPGTIKSITDFGVFVGLPGGIDGLVHLSDISWSETGEEAVRNFKKGDEIDAVVLGIDTDKERISLGVKQLEGDPFNNFVATYDKGAVLSGTVKSVEPKGAVVTLSVDVEGYLRASEISAGRVEDATTVLNAGDQVETMIINIDRKARSIQLSIKARDNAETAETIQRMTEASASSGTTNLGALLKAKLDQHRDE
ncbi:MAG: S1 RNA-binding domain-containing protein, partial [Castellaniella sp.]